ncbi:MAG: hypothetical protein OEZ04_04460 [Nitrospinota bacterium]|nr:hypothetical protein [Nitrospinota bacterium]
MKRAIFSSLMVAALALLSPVDAGAQETKVEIFRLGYADAVEMEKIASGMLSPTGKISINESSNSLVVVDTPAAIRRIRKILARLDVKPINIRIEVTFIEKNRMEKLDLKVRWRMAGSGWMIGSIPAPPGGAPLAVEALATTGKGESRNKQSILVMENTPGRIFVGGEYPSQARTVRVDRGNVYVTESTSFKSAGTSLYVIASRAGEGKLKIAVEPESSRLEKGTGAHDVKRASTAVVIDDPGTVVLSKTGGSSEGSSVNIPSGAEASLSSQSYMIILSARSEN